jgi:hypothetical protein
LAEFWLEKRAAGSAALAARRGRRFRIIITAVDAEDAFDAADDTAHNPSDHATDNGANRTSGLAADMRAMCGAVRNALRLCAQRHRKRDHCCACEKSLISHVYPPVIDL